MARSDRECRVSPEAAHAVARGGKDGGEDKSGLAATGC